MNRRRERVLAALRKRRGADGVIRTTYAQLARSTELSEATIGREIADLKADGLLYVNPRASLHRGQMRRGASEYRLLEAAETPAERVQRQRVSKPPSGARRRAQRPASGLVDSVLRDFR